MTSVAPRVLFLGQTYAGHKTRFLNLEAHSRADRRIRPVYRRVTGWVDGGAIERLPLLPRGVKGRARAVLEAAPLAVLPRPDVIWTGAAEVLTPYLWAQQGRLRRPLVLDLDWTLEQQEQLAPIYFGREPKSGVRAAVARLMERALWRCVTLFTPWTQWAADSLRRHGVAEDRIRVLPPGVDLTEWRPSPERRRGEADKLRLLFVGGDFARKGGDTLISVFRSSFADRCELDIVTRDAVEPHPGIRLHRAEPNSALMHDLYAAADLFVLPTRAECFGIAAVEAMASGLPVILGDVDGARDIVSDDETGWLVEPTHGSVRAALEHALTVRNQLPAMGLQGRKVAEQRFDGERNDRIIVDLLVEQASRRRSARTGREA